ncbi:MAG: serine hydrolase domain-containing protein [Bacteroidales bacterium]
MTGGCVKQDPIDDSLTLEQKIDRLMKPVVVFGNPNATIIGVYRDGEKSIFSYGDAGLGNGPPLSNTIFEIGSITKTFTATLLSQFITEGLVSLDDPIDRFLPDNVDPPAFNGEPITLRHLVTHTSGLPRSLYNFGIDVHEVWSKVETADLYEFLNNISQQAYPFDDYTLGNELQSLGTEYRYSNVGMAVLGHILELVSGQTFEQLVSERIISKLDMDNTGVYSALTGEQKGRIPKAYNVNQYEQELPHEMGAMTPAGGLLSTLDDMMNYMEANLQDSTLLSQSMMRCHEAIYDGHELGKMFPKRDADAIGMAWLISYKDNDTILSHNGGYNHLSYMKFSLTHKTGIVAFSNTAGTVEPALIETIFDWINE